MLQRCDRVYNRVEWEITEENIKLVCEIGNVNEEIKKKENEEVINERTTRWGLWQIR